MGSAVIVDRSDLARRLDPSEERIRKDFCSRTSLVKSLDLERLSFRLGRPEHAVDSIRFIQWIAVRLLRIDVVVGNGSSVRGNPGDVPDFLAVCDLVGDGPADIPVYS